MDLADQLIFVAGTLFLLSILATAFTPRLGVPLLLVFLVVGLLAGENGPGGIRFNDFRLASIAGTTALAVILFDGGLRTPLDNFRVAMRPALALSTVGVLVTTAVVGAFARVLLHLDWAQALLIGAIVGSTDAAAVFSLLHTSAVHLNRRITAVLEIESGTNDPMAVVLTLGLIEYLQAPEHYTALAALGFLWLQFGGGLLFGWAGGRLLVTALNRLELSETLYPLLAWSGGMLIFGGTALLHGSGFLAIYVAGLTLGNRPLRASGSIRRFHDGIAWLAQIGMFLILGLLATPMRLLALAGPALAVALVLILIARPLAVAVSLAPLRLPWREQGFIAWVGLRGSVPILLATFPVIAGLPHAVMFFDVAFFIVLVSLIVQGWTVAPMARLLRLDLPNHSTRVRRTELDVPGASGHEIVSYRISEYSPVVGRKPRELPIREVSRVVCITRNGELLAHRDWGTLRPGDTISLIAKPTEIPTLDEIFRRPSRPVRIVATQRAFGEFVIDPQATAEQLAQAYGIELPASASGKTLERFFTDTVPQPVVGDRLRLGDFELIVKRMEHTRVEELGLRLPRPSEE